MDSFKLKVLAVVLMVTDHVGLLISDRFPELVALSLVLRMIGRLSFPIFAWLAANAAAKSKNLNRYMIRLFVFALISQIPYALFTTVGHEYTDGTNVSVYGLWSIGSYVANLNIFFTLFAGVLACRLYSRMTDRKMAYGMVFLISVIAFLLYFDYTFFGVWLIFLFYRYLDEPKKGILSIVALNGLMLVYQVNIYLLATGGMVYFDVTFFRFLLQPLSLLALPILMRSNGLEGMKRWKYWFYLFYPLHLLALWAIGLLIV